VNFGAHYIRTKTNITRITRANYNKNKCYMTMYPKQCYMTKKTWI